MKKTILSLMLFALLTSCGEPTKPYPDEIDNSNIEFWMPIDSNLTDDIQIVRHQYTLSYSSERGTPNWVSYNLEENWFGSSPRYEGNFKSDPMIPTGFKIVYHDDYTNSGYDRGHLVRSEERTNADSNNIATFYMTNVIPMTPDLNRGPWLDLEYYCEAICKGEKKELYIMAGGIYHSNTWINDKVAVPDSCFKIIVIMNKDEGIRDVTDSTIVIAYVMPNISGIRNEDFRQWQTTVDRIENSTGYDFLRAISTEKQEKLESKIYPIKIVKTTD